LFANTLVLTNLSGNPSSKELLSRVHEVTLAAYPILPFEQVVEVATGKSARRRFFK